MRACVAVALLAFASCANAFLTLPSFAQVTNRAPASAVSSLTMVSPGKVMPKLGLPADQRKALLRGLTTEVIRHGRITTTLARAKAIREKVRAISPFRCPGLKSVEQK